MLGRPSEYRRPPFARTASRPPGQPHTPKPPHTPNATLGEPRPFAEVPHPGGYALPPSSPLETRLATRLTIPDLRAARHRRVVTPPPSAPASPALPLSALATPWAGRTPGRPQHTSRTRHRPHSGGIPPSFGNAGMDRASGFAPSTPTRGPVPLTPLPSARRPPPPHGKGLARGQTGTRSPRDSATATRRCATGRHGPARPPRTRGTAT